MIYSKRVLFYRLIPIFIITLGSGCTSSRINMNQPMPPLVGMDSQSKYIQQGIIYLENQKFRNAIKQFERAIKSNPKDPNAYYLLALVYYKITDYDKAIPLWSNAIEVYVADPQWISLGHSAMGLTLEQQGKTTEAIESYQRALRFNEKNEIALLGINRLAQ